MTKKTAAKKINPKGRAALVQALKEIEELVARARLEVAEADRYERRDSYCEDIVCELRGNVEIVAACFEVNS